MEMKIKAPKNFMNFGVTTEGCFVADTNDSANCDTMKIQLPRGTWDIKKVDGCNVVLKKRRGVTPSWTWTK